MSDAGRAAGGARVTLAGQAAKFLLQLLSTVLLARILTPNDFGVFAMVVAVTGFGALIGEFGLSTAAIQARTISQRQKSNLFWISAGVGGVLYVIFFLGAPLLEGFYGVPGLADVVRMMSTVFVLAALTSQFTAQLSRGLRFGRLAVVDVSAQAAAFACALWMALSGFGYWALVGQWVTAAAVTLILTVAFSGWVPGLPGRAPMKALIGFAVNTFGVQALAYVSGNADSVALGKAAGPDVVGLYDRAYQLFKIPVQQIAAPLKRVALPILSRHQSDRPTMSRYVVGAQLGMTYLLGAAFSLGAALASPVIEIALGPQWAAAAPLFAILAIGGIFQVMGYVYYWTFLACGLTGLQLRYSLLTRTLMILLIVGGAFFGAIGVAVGVSLGLAANWLILSLLPMRQTGLDVRAIVGTGLRGVCTSVGVAAVVALVDISLFYGLPAIIRIMLGLGVAIGVYSVLVVVSQAIRRDVLEVIRIVRKRAS